jgi:2-C-methyl-D-erythritol 2,4-cyclodiphosphate synthase
LPESRGSIDGGLRVGIGFDAHRFCEGRPLTLGGSEIPFEKGLLGHSDADVLPHALMDAILGALCEGDLGTLFPDTDPEYEGARSIGLLKEVVAMMARKGYTLVNADMTVVAERPRIDRHRERIEHLLSAALGAAPKSVSLKATTTEKLGFTGREEGIAAEAVVLLRAKADNDNKDGQ